MIAGLPLIVGEHQPAGPLPLTATDAGHRDVPITDQQGHPLTVAARAPAQLEPAITQVSDPLTVGGSNGVTLTVHNSGGTASQAAALGATLPTGVDVTSYLIDGASCTPGPRHQVFRSAGSRRAARRRWPSRCRSVHWPRTDN